MCGSLVEHVTLLQVHDFTSLAQVHISKLLVYGRVVLGPTRRNWPGSSRPRQGRPHVMAQPRGLGSSTTLTAQ